MTLKEKIAYIKGLTEGLKLDESKDEVKVINAVIECLEDMAVAVADMEDLYDEMSMQLDEVDEDLATLEDEVYDDCCCDDDCDCDCDCDDYDCDEDDIFYEVTCGSCGEVINVSEDVLLCGEIECPKCGEVLEFDFSDLCCDDDDDCDCGCGCGCDHGDEDLMS